MVPSCRTHPPLRVQPAPGRHALQGILSAVMLCTVLLPGSASSEAPRSDTERYAVVARELPWTPVSEPDNPAPLSRAWQGEPLSADWTVHDGRATAEPGVLLVEGPGHVDLLGPADGTYDPRVHQRIELTVENDLPLDLGIHWHSRDEEEPRGRLAQHYDVPASLAPVTREFELSAMPALHELLHAPRAAGHLHLRFTDAEGREVAVRIHSLRLLSDYDGLDGASTAGRFARAGTVHEGVAVRVPALLALPPLSLQGRDRLRFAAGVAGSTDPLPITLTVRWDGGAEVEQQFLLSPGDDWAPQRFDLPDAPAGQTAQVTLRAEAALPGTTLVVGDALQLAPSPGGPPIVLYLEDTLRADHLGTYGYGHPTDPHLQEIAAEGATFEHVHAPASWTRPSVSSLMTSRDVAGHGNRDATRRVSTDLTTLAEALAKAGWLTASFISNPHAGAWSGLDQGFDVASEGQIDASITSTTLTSHVLRESILAFLSEHRDERVFVYVHSMDPHAPYAPDDASLQALRDDPAPRATIEGPFAEQFTDWTLRYDGEIRHNDGELASLDAGLQALDLWDDTLLTFTSDHGEAFGEHRQWDHRRSVHEEELLVPWVLRWPGVVPDGARLGAQVSLLDLAPTLLGLASVAIPDGWQGRDLSALCRGARVEARAQEPLFIDTVHAYPIDGVAHSVAALHWPHKLLAAVDEEGNLLPQALYRLDDDPGERINHLGEPAAQSVEQTLLAWLAERLRQAPPNVDTAATVPAFDPVLREWMLQMGYLR